MIVMLLFAPFQPFLDVYYSPFQLFYMSFVLMIISITIHFYQMRMNEAKVVILEQQGMLKEKVEELTQKDKLLTVQSKQAVMGEMISMIAHQWRQPLSSVTLSISDIQLKKMLGNEVDDETMQNTLQSISDTVVYLSETIDDFQTYFQPNKNLSNVSLDSIMKKAINFVNPRVKGSSIVIEYNNRLEAKIETYSNELIQVILNILNNAIDELLLLKKDDLKIIIKIEEKDSMLALHIEDNGNGIAEENLDTIFEPYYSTKGKNGTGLGLYMSQMIMQKQFNSKIEVKSSQSGSIFTVLIPKKLS